MNTYTFECGPVEEEDEELTVTGVDEVGGCVVIGDIEDECGELLEAECGYLDELDGCGCGCC